MHKRTITVLISPVLLFSIGIWGLALSDSAIDFSTTDGKAVANFFIRVFPADFSTISDLVPLIRETALMALWGTLFAAAIGLFLSLFTNSRILNSHRLSRFAVQFFAVCSRSIPDLLSAFIFVSLIGPGTLAGILALTLASIGMFVRLLATRIDEIPFEKGEAFIATGMPKRSLRLSFVSQEIWPYFISVTAYRFDINVRSAVTLGLAGAGGIGVALKMYFGSLDYQSAAAVVVLIATFLLILEFTSIFASRSLAGLGAENLKGSRSKIKPLAKWAAFAAIAIFMLHGLFDAVQKSNLNVYVLKDFFGALAAPDFETKGSAIWAGLLQSLSLASVSMISGGLLALVVGVGASHNSGLPKAVLYASRAFLVMKRSVPTILFGIIFVIIFGLGSAAGVAALTLGVGGIGAKFIADSLDQIPQEQLLPIRALGLGRFQFIISGLLRLSFPTVLRHLLYMFELNIRYAAILGLIGAGGIGALVSSAIRSSDLATATAVIYLIGAVVGLVEIVSRWSARHVF